MSIHVLLFRVIVLMMTGQTAFLFHPSMTLHLVGMLALLTGWFVCRSGPRNKRLVEAAEAFSLIVSTIAYSAMGMFIPTHVMPEMIILLAMTLAVMARAVFVPSTAKRTAILSSDAAPPHGCQASAP